MKHKAFRILCLCALFIITILSGCYDYFVVKDYKLSLRIIVKTSPNLCLMVLTFSYIFIYRLTLYSCGTLLSLLLCLIGDICMAIFDPSLIDTSKNQMLYLILGGSFFFLARFVLTVILAIKPYKIISLIPYDKKQILISHIFFNIPFIILAILNLIRDTSLNSIFVSIYMVLGFGTPLSYSFLRIGALNSFEIQESRIASILAFLGIFLFNISDIILFICLFTNWLHKNIILFSINIYWISMYLISVSVVRSPEEYVEKGKDYYPVSFVSKTDFNI